MADRKSFLLRMDRELLDAVQRWANDDLRSLNAQIEFLLRRALQAEGRASRTVHAPSRIPDNDADSDERSPAADVTEP